MIELSSRRNNSEILSDIIMIIENGEYTMTRIMSLANISYISFIYHIKQLIDKGLVIQVNHLPVTSRQVYEYKLTDRGKKIATRIRDFADIRSLLE